MDYKKISSNYSEILYTYRFDFFDGFVCKIETDVSKAVTPEEYIAKSERLKEFITGENILDNWKKNIYDICLGISNTATDMYTFDRKRRTLITQAMLTAEEKQNILSWAKIISFAAKTGSSEFFERMFSKIVDDRKMFIIRSKLGFNPEGKIYENDELIEILGISSVRFNQILSHIREKIRSVSAPDISRIEERLKIQEEL